MMMAPFLGSGGHLFFDDHHVGGWSENPTITTTAPCVVVGILGTFWLHKIGVQKLIGLGRMSQNCTMASPTSFKRTLRRLLGSNEVSSVTFNNHVIFEDQHFAHVSTILVPIVYGQRPHSRIYASNFKAQIWDQPQSL